MKTKTILIAAVMCLAFSAAAFAQATLTVGSIPMTTVANNGQTEKTGDITFGSTYNSNYAVTGTITINYGVPITVDASKIRFYDVDPSENELNLSVNSIDNFAGKLVLNLIPYPASGGMYNYGNSKVSGVRVATAGSTLTNLSATISTTGNALVAGQTEVKVINAIAPPISTIYSSFFGTNYYAKLNAVSGATTSGSFSVVEGFLNAFGVTADSDNTQTDSNMIRFTLNNLPTAGVTLSFPQTVAATAGFGVPTGGVFEACDEDGELLGGAIAIDDESDKTFYYKVVEDTDQTQVETLTIPVNVSFADSYPTLLPLPQVDISVTATMAPIGRAFRTTPLYGSWTYSSPIPRYAAAEVGPALILDTFPAQTSLLIPYATTAFGYNTGIAIANTTKDPGSAAMGITGAVPQAGKITFYFYPNKGGTPFSLSTSDYPNTLAGTDATGNVVGGGMYTVTLSELLETVGKPADFTGYIIAICNFSNAHGQYFVSDFEFFTNGAQALVITDQIDYSLTEAEGVYSLVKTSNGRKAQFEGLAQ